MAVRRALLTSQRTVVTITLAGAGLAVAAQTISWFLLDVLGGRTDLEATASASMSSDELTEVMAVGWTGAAPTDTGWWRGARPPPSTTPPDPAATTRLGPGFLGGC